VVEEAALKEIQEAGYTVLEQQRPYTWSRLQLTGHIDGKILVGKKAYPIEIKTINPYDFEKINSVEDLLSSEKFWLRKYPAQLTLYMLLSEEETALLYLKNALTWEPKSIWITLDYDFADELVRKLEDVNKHVRDNTVPEGINDADICPDCPFFHICLPEIKGEGLPIQDDQDLIAILEEWESLRPAYTRYQQLDAILKQRLEGVERLMVGNWLITGRWLERKGYVVEPGRYWQRKIRKIGGE
jgi:CRISPR/Cas system-associated exonuclease Cas4 (RecB family)